MSKSAESLLGASDHTIFEALLDRFNGLRHLRISPPGSVNWKFLRTSGILRLPRVDIAHPSSAGSHSVFALSKAKEKELLRFCSDASSAVNDQSKRVTIDGWCVSGDFVVRLIEVSRIVSLILEHLTLAAPIVFAVGMFRPFRAVPAV